MLTLASLMSRNRLVAGGRPALISEDGDLCWRDLVERVSRLAGALAAMGVGRGDRFAIVARNSARQFEWLHAGYWSGAIAVPLNWRLVDSEIARLLEQAAVKVVAFDAVHAASFVEGALQPWATRSVWIGGAAGDFERHHEALVASGPALACADPGEDDVALLLYTGGTTGRAKGVPLTHRNIVANALQIASLVGCSQDDVYLHVAPMFHSADLIANSVSLHGGAHAFLPQYGAGDFVAAVETLGVTRTMLAPTMLLSLLDHGLSGGRPVMPTLKQVFYGSSAMPQPAIVRVLERLPGVALWQGYGLTETSPLLTVLSMHAHLDALAKPGSGRLASAGQPLPGVDLRIVRPDGVAACAGEPGEVWARGPNVVRGYDAPSDDEGAFVGPWFRTGDVGSLDDEGFLTLLDRLKDMVITGGENVYSMEVEAVLQLHPSVREVAVVGVPDERFGEALLAVVVCHPGTTLDADAIVRHCRERLGGFKIPRRLMLVDTLPRTALGKVDKRSLRQTLA